MSNPVPSLAAAILLTLVSVSAGAAGPPTGPAAMMVTASGLPAIRLLNAVATPAGNVVVSPIGVWTVLAMLAEGGDDQARTGLAKLAGVQGIDGLRQLVAGWRQAAQRRSEGAELTFAAGLWADQSVRLIPIFETSVRDKHNAGLRRAALSKPEGIAAVNQWVATATRNRIPILLEQPLAPGALAMLSALTFDGTWTLPFDPARTAPAPFRVSSPAAGIAGPDPSVAMMSLDAPRLAYREEKGFQAVTLPYGDRHWQLTVVLPADKTDPFDWLRRSSGQAAEVLAGLGATEQAGLLKLPRLNLAVSTELLKALAQMGLSEQTSRANSFAGIATPAPILARVVQKIALKSDEKGTTVAAATAATTDRSLAAVKKFTMVVDRPFLFSLHDESGRPLILGVVREPGDLSAPQ